MYISPAEAIRTYDVSKPTLYKDMNNGTVSFERDNRNRRKLVQSELERVYKKREIDSDSNTQKDVNVDYQNTELNVNYDSFKIKMMEDKIEMLEREIEKRENDVVRWEAAFEKAQSTADKITKLIEHTSHTQGGGKKLQTLEDSIEQITKQNSQIVRELKNQRDVNVTLQKQLGKKSFWDHLFGR